MKTNIFLPICIFIAASCSQPNQKINFEIRELNFGDSENRLWASVFILRMEDHIELKVKRYLAR